MFFLYVVCCILYFVAAAVVYVIVVVIVLVIASGGVVARFLPPLVMDQGCEGSSTREGKGREERNVELEREEKRTNHGRKTMREEG